jgi:thioredoxin reductase (NADPH)
MAETHPVDVCVVGAGPAGLSAAIYAVRAGLSVVLLGRDSGSLARAHEIENYFGFVEPISGSDLLERGIAQAHRLGVEIVQAEVTGINYQEEYEILTTAGTYQAPCLILATGMPRRKASVAGLNEYEGRGVSYCSICDGFFFRGKNIAVIGTGAYAFKEVEDLRPIAGSITVFTNGRPLEAGYEQTGGTAVRVDLRPILRVEGDEYRVKALIVAAGQSPDQMTAEELIAVDGIFVAEGTASALDLALMLGLEIDGKAIKVDCGQQTNLPGLFAIGDCTGGIMQVAVVVGEGAKAGIAAASYVRERKLAKSSG